MTPDASFCPKTSPLPSVVLSGKALGSMKAFRKMVLDPQVASGTQNKQDYREGSLNPQTGPHLNRRRMRRCRDTWACLPHTYSVGMFL